MKTLLILFGITCLSIPAMAATQIYIPMGDTQAIITANKIPDGQRIYDALQVPTESHGSVDQKAYVSTTGDLQFHCTWAPAQELHSCSIHLKGSERAEMSYRDQRAQYWAEGQDAAALYQVFKNPEGNPFWYESQDRRLFITSDLNTFILIYEIHP